MSIRDKRLTKDLALFTGLTLLCEGAEEEFNLCGETYKGYTTKVSVTDHNGNFHVFYIPPNFPFGDPPVHVINGVMDRSFVRHRERQPGYTGPFTKMERGWAPSCRLNSLVHDDIRLKVKKLSEITDTDIGDPCRIIINIGYCNQANSGHEGYPHRFISGTDEQDLYIQLNRVMH